MQAKFVTFGTAQPQLVFVLFWRNKSTYLHWRLYTSANSAKHPKFLCLRQSQHRVPVIFFYLSRSSNLVSRYGSLKHDYPFSSYVCNRNQQDTQEGFGLSIFSPVLTSLDFNNQNTFSLRDDVKKKIVKRVTSYIFQITPSLLALRMTSERMTNHNNQWVPPSLRKEWLINVLREVLEG